MNIRLLLTTIIAIFFLSSLGMRNVALSDDPRPKPRPRAVVEHLFKATEELCSDECSVILDVEAAAQGAVVPLPPRTYTPPDQKRSGSSRHANALPIPRAPPAPPFLVS